MSRTHGSSTTPPSAPTTTLVTPTPEEIRNLVEDPAAAAARSTRAVPDPDALDDEQEAAPLAPGTGAITRSDLIDVTNAISVGIAEGMKANAPRRKVSFGEYDPRTPFQPDKRNSIPLKRACFQNGAQMRPINLFNKEIDLLNAVTHSGRYIDRLVEVVLVPNGADDEVHLRYNDKTVDQRMTNKGKWRDLTDMLQQIVTAQALERAEDERGQSVRAQRTRR